jgi:leucyl aminopeptidase
MRVEITAVSPEQVEADVVAVPLAEDGLDGRASALDSALGGLLGRLAGDGELRGETGRASLVHVDGKLGAARVAVAGIGRRDRVDADSLRTAAAAVAHDVGSFAQTVAWVLDDSLPVPVTEQARAIVEGTALGAYDTARWKRDEPKPKLETLLLCGEGDGLEDTARRAAVVAEWTNRARDLVNSPPNELTPERLAERAQELAASVQHVTASALEPDEIRERGMGAFAAVAQGSDNPARLVVLRYDPPNAKGDLVLGLVGKAITFDTGGISLKPALHMEDMKGDMAGGAAVVEATGAIAELGLPLRVLTVAAATENMPSGHAYRPGDIITAANGKTIEITNTDAEGRLVLADALWYARQEGATHILDLATLTGAMEVALGDLYAGIFANDDAWREEVVAAGEASGDHAWPFPMHPRYRRYVDSVYADLKNSSDLRQAGAVLAAAFLEEFAGEGPWAHADIAGPAFLERSRGDYMSQRGGTGYGVRLIVELAQRLSDGASPSQT